MATGLPGHAVAMARNNIWANHRLLTACKALTPEEFAAKRTSFFPSLRATLNHILWVDVYYIDALHRDPTVLDRYRRPDPGLPRRRVACTRRRSPATGGCSPSASARPRKAWPRPCSLPRPNRTPPPSSVISILEHLFQHQTHHRGQAHAMLASTSVKPPQLDEFFLAGEQHLRRDELLALGLEPS